MAPNIRQDQPDPEPQGVRLVTAVVCDAVVNRSPGAEKATFDGNTSRRVYVWMEVLSDQQPFAIRHVYYRNDQKYCDVPLDIKYPRMRTWSYVTLGKSNQSGLWRVDIVCEGVVLKSLRFDVM